MMEIAAGDYVWKAGYDEGVWIEIDGLLILIVRTHGGRSDRPGPGVLVELFNKNDTELAEDFNEPIDSAFASFKEYK